MPVTAKISTVIAPQSIETIGVRIAEILSAEFTRQRQLSTSNPAINRVWLERFNTWDANEYPAVNVNLHKADYTTQDARRTNVEYLYNIDVYTAASTSGTVSWGDTTSMQLMMRIIGMARAIIKDSAWATLGFNPGTIGSVMVEKVIIGDKSTSVDAVAGAVGRLQVRVSAVEANGLSSSVPLELSHTTFKLNSTENGFYIETDTTE